jgi:hypothetical protein
MDRWVGWLCLSGVWWLGGCQGSDSNGNTAGAGSAGVGGATAMVDVAAERFSFFMTSQPALQRMSGSRQGFGGDLRYGEADGLSGADKICREIAESSAPGASKRVWRAFLSATRGPDGLPVHAIDRIGPGPWYDRLGRLIALDRAALLNTRPAGADPAIANDLPNELGVPNHAPDGEVQVDNHDVLTGTNDEGRLYMPDWSFTCHDWTSSQGVDGTPRVGHSWPRSGTPEPGLHHGPISGTFAMMVRGNETGAEIPGAANAIDEETRALDNWMSALDEAGCAPGGTLNEMGPPRWDNPTVGSGGGYGGIYCFALLH